MSDFIRRRLAEGMALLRVVAIGFGASRRCLSRRRHKQCPRLKSGHKLMVAGNGGSAADAQHLVAEFVGRLCEERPLCAQ